MSEIHVPQSNKDFVHLHCHSCHSKQDALPTPANLAKGMRSEGFLAGAITDHGEMSGIVPFVSACRAPGDTAPITPILGIEAYMCPDHTLKNQLVRPDGEKYYEKNWHLTLLAENYTGYRNLIKLSSMAAIDGFYRFGRNDRKQLFDNSEGIIVLGGCMSSEVNQAILRGDIEEAERIMRAYKDCFGDRYYIEIMWHGIPEEKIIIKELKTLGKKLDIKIVITNDVHYLNSTDWFVHDILIEMRDLEDADYYEKQAERAGTGEEKTEELVDGEEPQPEKKKRHTKKEAYSSHQFYLKTAQEIHEHIGQYFPGAMNNTREVAERIQDFLPLDVPNTLPPARVPEGNIEFDEFHESKIKYLEPTEAYLYYLAHTGLREKGFHTNPEYLERLKFELFTICCMGVPNYFLIMREMVEFMRSRDIYFGVRGSSVGSLVNWCLNISAEDPIKFGLLFERFLNPGRGDQYKIDYSCYPLKQWSAERKDKEGVISEEEAHARLSKLVAEKVKEPQYLKHGPKIKKELWVIENQYLCSYLCDLADSGYTTETNESQLWLAYFLGISKQERTDDMIITISATLPDIDVDIQDDERDTVVDFMIDRFGEDYVANIGTVGTYKAKNAVVNVLKSYPQFVKDWERPNAAIPTTAHYKAQEISKLIPNRQTPPITLDEAIDESPDFARWAKKYPEAIDIACQIMGTMSHRGIHPAGLVVSKNPIVEASPLVKMKKKNARTGVTRMVTCTAYDMGSVERVGLVKYDLLGLKLYQKIARAVRLIEKRHGIKIDINDLSQVTLEDKEIFHNVANGQTATLFQFSSPGMQDALMQVRVDNFEDLVAVVALYRPGPKKFIPSYSARKHGIETVDFDHDIIKQHLESTYGIMVYQEQAMKIARDMAKFNLQEVDKLRGAISKKKQDVFEKLQKLFKKRAGENNIPDKVSDDVLTMMYSFGEYAFNRSHALGYAKLAYVTAFLRFKYPHEWLTACMQVDGTGSDGPAKLSSLKQVAKTAKITVQEPDINESGIEISLTPDGRIMLPLTVLKGVKNTVLPVIEHQPFKDFRDFIIRARPNLGLVKSLALGNALRCFKECAGRSQDEILQLYDEAIEERKELDKQAKREAKAKFNVISPRSGTQGFVTEKELTEISIAQPKRVRARPQINGVMTFKDDLFS